MFQLGLPQLSFHMVFLFHSVPAVYFIRDKVEYNVLGVFRRLHCQGLYPASVVIYSS